MSRDVFLIDQAKPVDLAEKSLKFGKQSFNPLHPGLLSDAILCVYGTDEITQPREVGFVDGRRFISGDGFISRSKSKDEAQLWWEIASGSGIGDCSEIGAQLIGQKRRVERAALKMERDSLLLLLSQTIGFVMINAAELNRREDAMLDAIARPKFQGSPPAFDDDCQNKDRGQADSDAGKNSAVFQ